MLASCILLLTEGAFEIQTIEHSNCANYNNACWKYTRFDDEYVILKFKYDLVSWKKNCKKVYLKIIIIIIMTVDLLCLATLSMI